MKYLIYGSGGVGSYYGARLFDGGFDVTFLARNEHLKAIRENGLVVKHSDFEFHKKVDAREFNEISADELAKFDAILLATKANSTKEVAKTLSEIFTDKEKMPYIVSLQNGVENEEILCKFLPCEKIIGGLSRKIGAHIISPGVIESTGKVETIIGAMKPTAKNELFMQNLKDELNASKIECEIVVNIKLELWKKLIINNGVNAICALLEIKTGELTDNENLSFIVYNLMQETAAAAKAKGVHVSLKDVKEMFEIIKQFDSIKPSMLVDKEHKRKLEIDEICGVVLRCSEAQNINAPYTKTISYLLDFISKR